MAPLIKAPVAEFNGSVGGVQFANGEAETDNPAVIAYCKAAGYTIEASKKVAKKATKPEPGTDPAADPKKPGIELDGKPTPPPAGNASREDWEAFALLNGKSAEELDGLSRDEIRDLLTPAE